ncbi:MULTISPECIES: fructose-6-phosphate aldolase [Celeribacter]|jgi:transaldolase|uniref:fructose-6-phosphate aldolase n=1 Tax=Celeribacter TaxID=875170 RepID=UPI001C08AFA5|nr:fructose-6-phosphate aldolase [Celeribacter halophilus]MBU2891236.1 fructose-6-phosphate aldolase [Celeribacter halophilus]MDO6510877.1 fructose-6-phosphate aldolase [Celeribacter halophilus]
MKFFVDTADVEAIRELNDLGFVDGVTTNPSLIKKSGRDILEVTKEICDIVGGPVSAEVVALDYDSMVAEGRKLAKIASNVVIKLPLTLDGLKACKTLSGEGHKINVTLCFSANQALLAAKAGATYISPFIGRLDDINIDGLELIEDIRTIYDNYGFETEILAASIRTANHMSECAKIGADVATAPPAVIKAMANHVLTDKGLAQFVKDAEDAGIKIV